MQIRAISVISGRCLNAAVWQYLRVAIAPLWLDRKARSLRQISGVIENVFVLYEYRESANPAYPELKVQTYRDVFQFLGVTGEHIKIGVAAWLNTNLVMMEGLRDNYPKAEIVRAR